MLRNEREFFVQCRVILREPGEVLRKEDLGLHTFGRVPIAGEFVSLDADGPHLRVTHVHHVGFSHTAAELFCVAAKSATRKAEEFHPPAE